MSGKGSGLDLTSQSAAVPRPSTQWPQGDSGRLVLSIQGYGVQPGISKVRGRSKNL